MNATQLAPVPINEVPPLPPGQEIRRIIFGRDLVAGVIMASEHEEGVRASLYSLHISPPGWDYQLSTPVARADKLVELLVRASLDGALAARLGGR